MPVPIDTPDDFEKLRKNPAVIAYIRARNRLGGQARSARKAAASRRNGKRPKAKRKET